MGFAVGKKVQVMNNNGCVRPDLIGAVGTITAPYIGDLERDWRVEIPGKPTDDPIVGWSFRQSNLKLLDDDSDYERFMERVMKPVDLGQPVAA